jgi:hypothetical protein
MSDEIIDDDPHPDPVPESAPEPGSQSELELPERPEVAPVAGEAGAAPATATEVVFVEDAEDEALTEDAGLAAATTNVPPVEEAGLAEDVGGSPGQAAGQVTAATTKAATKADGPKSAKTKSSKGKSGKGGAVWRRHFRNRGRRTSGQRRGTWAATTRCRRTGDRRRRLGRRPPLGTSAGQ